MFSICVWDVKPIMMTVMCETSDKDDFIFNLCKIIDEVEKENNIIIDINNIFDFINIDDSESNLSNKDLLNYIESESLKELDEITI